MTIDMHSHWKSSELADAMRARTAPPRIVCGDDGVEILEGRFGIEPLDRAFDDVDVRLESMDHRDITKALLSMLPCFGWIERLPIDESVPLVARYNDAISNLCARHGNRFTAVAALPRTDMSAAAAEFERALSLPGIVGAMVPGDGFLTRKRADALAPVLDVADRHGALVFVHRAALPGEKSSRPAKDVDNFTARDSTLDMQASLSSITVTLCLTDLPETYPGAIFLTHNLGGNIPFELERLDHRSVERHPGQELPSSRLRRTPVMVDCNSFGPRAIERAVEVFGAKKIVFGSDGSDFGADWSIRAVNDAQIDNAAKHAILSGNAAALLDQLTAVRQAAE
jgi:predicted TIM-barrel fold metal-dependent hydrolase